MWLRLCPPIMAQFPTGPNTRRAIFITQFVSVHERMILERLSQRADPTCLAPSQWNGGQGTDDHANADGDHWRSKSDRELRGLAPGFCWVVSNQRPGSSLARKQRAMAKKSAPRKAKKPAPKANRSNPKKLGKSRHVAPARPAEGSGRSESDSSGRSLRTKTPYFTFRKGFQ